MDSVGDVLRCALEFEQRGSEAYRNAAAQTADTVLKSVLTALAHDEEAHAAMIGHYYGALQRGQGWPEIDISSAPPVSGAQRVAEIIRKTAGSITPGDTFLSIYETARSMEILSRDFYLRQIEYSDDPQIVKLCKFLCHTEEAHLEMLEVLLDSTRRAASSENAAPTG